MTKARTNADNVTADISGITAGTGITGGGTSGTVTITNSMATAIDAAGDLIYGTGADTFTKLGIGSSAQVLTVASGIPSWAAPASGATFAGCRLTKNNSQAYANDTFVILTWDVETFDVGGYHDTSTNNSRITIPAGKAGYYLFTCILSLQSGTFGSRLISLRKNGTNVASFQVRANTASGYPQNYVGITSIENAAVDDYYEIRAWQDSTETQGFENGTNHCIFSTTYLGA